MKKIIIGVAVMLLLAIGVLSAHQSRGRSFINLAVVPTGAQVKLDGKGVKGGTVAASAGTHTVEVSKTGFSTQKRSVTIKKGEIKYVGFVLQPNSPDTNDWYATHPEDAKAGEGITSNQFDQDSNDLINQNPLLSKLPHIGPGLIYRIDYGLPSTDSKTGQPGIYIRYRTESDKQAALQWIKDQGVNTTSLDIIYIQGNF